MRESSSLINETQCAKAQVCFDKTLKPLLWMEQSVLLWRIYNNPHHGVTDRKVTEALFENLAICDATKWIANTARIRKTETLTEYKQPFGVVFHVEYIVASTSLGFTN